MKQRNCYAWYLSLTLLTIMSPLNVWPCQPSKLPLIQVEMNGKTLYYQYIDKAGVRRPTVIFESGRGDDHSTWNRVVEHICTFANTFTYDRFNTGQSQRIKKAITAKDVAKRLKKLLAQRNIKPPYILVGHSDGGLYVQMFARLYPKATQGVVLVDSASAYQTITSPTPHKTNREYYSAIGFPISQKQLKQAPPFPNVPLFVVTASYHGYKNQRKTFKIMYKGKLIEMSGAEDQKLWEKWQNQLATLSTKGVHIYAYSSSHYIQTEQPALIADAIYTVFKKSITKNDTSIKTHK